MNLPRQHDWMATESDSVPQPAGSVRAGEEGFMLLAVVVMSALLLLALSVAATVVARQLQRDKEVESQQRMEQYVRAIQLYQRQFPGQYPASIKALENTNNVRFLRHVYVDPLTGKANFRLIHQGEQQTKIHVFFGESLDDLVANLGSAAGMQAGGAGGMMGGAGGMVGGSMGAPGASPTSTSPTSTSPTDGSASSGTSGSSGTGSSGTGSSGTGAMGSESADSLGSDNTGLIVGVGTSKTGTSITQPNGQTTYETWEFWYDPRIEMLKTSVNLTGGSMMSGGVGSQSAIGYGQTQPGQSNTIGGASTPGTTGSTGTAGTSGTGSSSTQ